MPAASRPQLPPRIVHLLGGVRAVDDGQGQVVIEIAADRSLGQFQAPPYPNLYATLRGIGFIPLGCEFLNSLSLRGLDAPDWECASPAGGFLLREERLAWGNIRTAAITDKNAPVEDLASRASTYLDLLAIRIMDLSNAYNQALAAYQGTGGKIGHMFGNGFQTYIDAAIHAFVADAASYRDLIAETVWRLVLGESEKVTTLATFIKKAAKHGHPLATRIIAETKPGGWLKAFTDLRNDIIHVAPVGRGHAFHLCETRELRVKDGAVVPQLHYPILKEDGTIWKSGLGGLGDDDEAMRAKLAEYRAYLATSLDGLAYAWNVLASLAGLHKEARVAANPRAEQRVITKEDIVGEIRRVTL
jgi:hypothetical protein